ncbi:MAG: redoxin domain-containing protein [Phycisphaerae bacterium]|nr:redoxin domain-containing protein [Phycisphaerae bacterium]
MIDLRNAISRTAVVVVACTLACPTASGQETPPAKLQPAPKAEPAKPEVPLLSIGDKAPPFDIEHWIKGDQISEYPPGKITVMEFWATWCGPCKVGMPHLSEMQERFRDYGVQFIGVSDEKLDTVSAFVAKPEWDAKMRYTVATDPDRSTYTSFMTAARQSGIPTAFVVGKQGIIEWVGHPTNLDKVLDEIVHDKWDAAAFKSKFDAEARAESEWRIQGAKIKEAQQAGDWNTVIAIYDGIIEKNPDNVGVHLQKMQVCLMKANRPDDGYAIAKELADKSQNNPMVLNQIAWTLVDPKAPITQRNYPLAKTIAEQAVKASDSKDGPILDTLARCYWEMGDKAKAIEMQKKAVSLTEGPMKAQIAETLEEYEAAK